MPFQEKTDDAKKAKKEENGDGDDDDEDLDEEEIEEYNLDYNDDEEIDGEGELLINKHVIQMDNLTNKCPFILSFLFR